MSHYDLAEKTGRPSEEWRQFLIHPEVKEWLQTEMQLIQDSELKKMVKDVSKSRSVGQAQMMNALSKLNDIKPTKDGPIFIYTYVPLDKNEENAPNVTAVPTDIFIK